MLDLLMKQYRLCFYGTLEGKGHLLLESFYGLTKFEFAHHVFDEIPQKKNPVFKVFVYLGMNECDVSLRCKNISSCVFFYIYFFFLVKAFVWLYMLILMRF